VDDYWNHEAKTCVAKASTTGNRVWLAIYEPGGFQLSTHTSDTSTAEFFVDCQDWFRTLQGYTDHVRGEVTRATEQARRAGVYPGVIRDVRREYRLEWAGW
jgi:hypothetical protein